MPGPTGYATAMRRPHDQQRIANVASGYCFACWGSTSLAWLSLAVLPGLAGLFGIMASFAALLGLPRTLQTLRAKFIVLPVATLAYLGLAAIVVAIGPPQGQAAGRPFLIFSGLAYSALLGPVVWSIARHDFARHVPAWACRSCGHVLLGLASDTCPECGERFERGRVPDIAPKTEAEAGEGAGLHADH